MFFLNTMDSKKLPFTFLGDKGSQVGILPFRPVEFLNVLLFKGLSIVDVACISLFFLQISKAIYLEGNNDI